NAHGVFRSTDQGDSWTLTGMENVDVRTLLSYTPEKIFAGAWFDGAFRFDPTAAAWSPSGLPATHVMDLTANGSGEIFAATHGRGVSRSTDGGVTWEDFNDGNISGGVWSLALSSEGYLFAGTSGSGIFRTAAPLVTTIDPGIAMRPARFVLEQNYPNPFNPVTNFGFRISDFGFVSLKIYDVTGREVATLVESNLPAGEYRYQWDARGQASGVYFYTLTSGEQRQTRRMILMR
ncbi:MAG: T9SS type A sorting domain-containing protein, partial [Calditrichaeota bacterium]|nr:T9SS type A sorting domain-containing protein [Calditrichota bacterium]